MSFAVVFFPQESQYSELPTNWLSPCQKKCMWPPNNPKNLSSLIKNRVEPKEHWDIHNIQVEGIFETLDKARKKAAASDGSTTEEERGRGLRKKFTMESSDEEYERENSFSPPPALNLDQAKIIWEEPSVIQISQEDLNENCEETENININAGACSISKSRTIAHSMLSTQHSVSEISASSENNINDEASVAKNSSSNEMFSRKHLVSENSKGTSIEKNDVIAFSATTTCSSIQHSVSEENSIEGSKLDKLLKMTSSLLLHVMDLSTRFDKFDKCNNPQAWDYFSNTLPCSSYDEIKILDDYLLNEEHQKQFIQYLQSIGGITPKDKVNRIMKAIFTNEFGTKCSWLGLRNNIKASNFKCIQVARASSAASVTIALFDKFAGEWLRLSRLRLSREK